MFFVVCNDAYDGTSKFEDGDMKVSWIVLDDNAVCEMIQEGFLFDKRKYKRFTFPFLEVLHLGTNCIFSFCPLLTRPLFTKFYVTNKKCNTTDVHSGRNMASLQPHSGLENASLSTSFSDF